jgi:peroxiredoxin
VLSQPFAAVALLVITLVVAIGCSPADGSRSKAAKPANLLHGTLSYGGVPVWEGRITLLGDDLRVATAQLARDGSFTLVNPPRGRARIAVTNHPSGFAARTLLGPELDLPGVAKCVVPDRMVLQFPAKFADPETSPWTTDIEPKQEFLTLDVPREASDPPPVSRPDSGVGPEIGDHAPDIEGEDLQGEPLQLSQHRGKVVALVFWAHWCNLCRAEFPHYRTLAERAESEPFVLLGINCDPDREFLLRENLRKDIPWRSWWDGASIGGPVTAAYQFQGFPAVMLIDDQGIIRHRNLRGEALDHAIDELIASMDHTREQDSIAH